MGRKKLTYQTHCNQVNTIMITQFNCLLYGVFKKVVGRREYKVKRQMINK